MTCDPLEKVLDEKDNQMLRQCDLQVKNQKILQIQAPGMEAENS